LIVKFTIKETGGDNTEWVYLVQNRSKWRDLWTLSRNNSDSREYDELFNKL